MFLFAVPYTIDMERRWTSFNSEITNSEFLAIPAHDRAALFGAMKAYRLALPGGFVVKNYGDGLMMIKAANKTQGRCLFFSVRESGGEEVLTALLAYKKETQEVPANVLATAKARMKTPKGE
jgi:hypothetical protein